MGRTIDLRQKHKCSWCSKSDLGMERHLDCAKEVHWFHLPCWLKHVEWMKNP